MGPILPIIDLRNLEMSPQGEARVGQGAHLMGPCPAPACAVCVRLQRLCQAKPEQHSVRRSSAAVAQ